MSVTNWCRNSGFGSGSQEREERCAWITGDVSARAVELLNQAYQGTFVASTALPSDDTACTACHHKGDDFAAGQFVMSKINCRVCHMEPVLDPH